ncbi:hypothetical protein K1719_019738 [Acacia pycnantha]|nr:hypothetical protein K1719_019738 [Acacia pycnantha]
MDAFSLGVDGPLHRHAIKTDEVYPMCYAPTRVRRAISVGLPGARQIEQEAYATAGDSASAEDDGIEILRAYSKEIGNSMRYGTMLLTRPLPSPAGSRICADHPRQARRIESLKKPRWNSNRR